MLTSDPVGHWPTTYIVNGRDRMHHQATSSTSVRMMMMIIIIIMVMIMVMIMLMMVILVAYTVNGFRHKSITWHTHTHLLKVIPVWTLFSGQLIHKMDQYHLDFPFGLLLHLFIGLSIWSFHWTFHWPNYWPFHLPFQWPFHLRFYSKCGVL